jgi:AbrB family looped-hinge helix DNA binding protein
VFSADTADGSIAMFSYDNPGGKITLVLVCFIFIIAWLLTYALHMNKVKHMKTITLSSKNQVVIPSAARAKLGIHSGDRLVIERVTASEIILKKEPTYRDLIGRLPRKDKDAVARIREIRDNWK